MANKLTVGEWMTKSPITIEHDASVIEAIHLLKQDHPEFMSDLEVQRYALTLNANDFLKRVR